MNPRFLVSAVLGAALMLGAAAAAHAEDVYRNPAGHVPPGLEKQDKVPPGQAKKVYRDDRRDHRYDGDGRYDRNHRYDRDRDHRYEGDRRHERDRDKHYDGNRRDRDGKRD